MNFFIRSQYIILRMLHLCAGLAIMLISSGTQDMVTEGKIKHLAVTNFDTDNFKASRDGGINLVSNQVQFSLIDQRPLAKMAPYCGAEGAKILAYGTGQARRPPPPSRSMHRLDCQARKMQMCMCL
jgi:aryl-alcohol dehydrogenase-like predicted oxidoreductase